MTTNRGRVVIADFIDDAMDIERSVLDEFADVEACNATDESQLLGRIETADAVMLYHHIRLTRLTLERLQRCKIIARCGVGFDNVDAQAARSRSIPVVNVPDYGTEEVADSAVGMLLALARGIHLYDRRMRRQPDPWSYSVAAPLHRLRGRTCAIIGLGRIGTATALRVRSLGMDVVFYDPYQPDGYEKAIGIRRALSLEECLGQAFVVSLHCPLTDQTRQMINAQTLASMPGGSFLINTARGACVDVEALPQALQSGRLAGAALDVLPWEPPAADSLLLAAWRDPSHPAYDRLILNPHAAFYSEEGLQDMRRKGAEACLRALLGQPLRNVVN